MKKQLTRWLFGFLLLAGTSATASVQTIPVEFYKPGEPITSQEQLTSGKYLIYAYAKSNGRFLNFNGSYLGVRGVTEIGETGVNATYLYDIKVNDDHTFTISTFRDAFTFPVDGANGQGKGNMTKDKAIANGHVDARFNLVEVTETDRGNAPADVPLFYFTPSNASFDGNDGTPTYIGTNGNDGDGHICYWSGTGTIGTSHYTGLALYPAVPVGNSELSVTARAYYIKLNEAENTYLYLDDTSDTKAHVSTSGKTPVKLIPGTGQHANKFAIRNLITDKYLISDGSWTTTRNSDNPYYWYLSIVDDGSITIAEQNDVTDLLGTQVDDVLWSDNSIGRTGTTGGTAWTAKCKWTIEKAPVVTVTVNFKSGDKIVETQTDEGLEDLTYSVPVSNPLASGTATGTFGNSDITIDQQVTMTMPFPVNATEDDWNNLIWCAPEAHGNMGKYMWTHNDGANLSDDQFERPNSTRYPDNQLFAFIGNYNDGFKIVNKAAGQGFYLTFENGVAKMVQNPENKVWNVYPTTAYANAHPETYACFKLVQGTSESAYLNHNSGNHNFQAYSYADEGSSNRFFGASTPLIDFYNAHTTEYEGNEAALTAYNNATSDIYNIEYADALQVALDAVDYSADFEEIKRYGNSFIDLFTPDQATIDAWNAVANQEGKKTLSKVDQLKAAFQALTIAASKTIDGKHVRIKGNRTPAAEHYLVPTHALDQLCTVVGVNVDKQVFTLKHANENGFYLYNEYTDKYAKSPANESNQTQLVKNVADATVYQLKVSADGFTTGKYAISAVGRSGNPEGLHENGSHNSVNWNVADPCSWWLFSLATDEDAVNEHYAGAKAYYEGLAKTEGETGTFYVTDANQTVANAAIATAEAEGVSAEDKYTAANEIFNTPLTLAMPKAGHFYRLRNVSGNKYLSSTLASNDRFSLVNSNKGNDVDNTYATLFYFDGQKLISVGGGTALGAMTNNTTRLPVLATSGSTYTFEVSDNYADKYFIKAGNYYIYNASAHVDSGNGHDNRDGYRWTITEATWIPLPGSENRATTTICSPVALDFDQHTGYRMYTASVGEHGKVILTQISGSVIPANTPVVLYFDETTEIDATNHCVFAKVGAVDTNSETRDNYMSRAKASGKNYLSMVNGQFTELTDANLPGFKAVLSTEAAIPEGGFTMCDDHLYNLLFNPAGKVYTIKNSDTGNNRGYLVYDANQHVLWTSNKLGKGNADADAEAPTNVNYHWTFIPDGNGQYYLYNLGARKYAAAFEVADKATHFNNDANCHAEFYWHFSDYPTAVSVEFGDYDEQMYLNGSVFNIYGGQNNNTSAGNRLPGMVVVNGYPAPVPGIAGNSAKDGCGFIFTEVNYETAPELPTDVDINAAHEEMAVAYTDAVAAADIDDPATGGVGYYTPDNLTAFREAFTQVADDADAEAKYYAVVRAHNAVTNKAYNEFQPMHAYQLKVGDQYVNATATAPFFTLGALDEVKDSNNSNWRAEDVSEDGTLRFTHVLGVEEGTEPAAAPSRVQRRAKVNQTVFFAATPSYDGLGNVTLGVEGIDSEGKVRVTSLGEDPNGTHTTAIREVEAAADCEAEVIYDLQGRRVNKAGHGFYIINGKKVIK